MDLVSYTTFWGFFLCGVDVILMLLAKVAGNGSMWAALAGVVMIGLSAWSIGLFTDVHHFFDVIARTQPAHAKDVAQGLKALNLWVLVIPAAIAGVGVNLVSAWVTK